jgi:serine/threonine-protein kinase
MLSGLFAFFIFNFVRKYIRLTIFWKNKTYVGNYKLLDKIDSGGMGTVFRAESLTTRKQIVALKILNEKFFAYDDARQRFNQEARIIDKLDHPHIVKIIERGESKQSMFIAMEYLDGITLEQKIANSHPMPLLKCLHIMLQVTRAVAEIHSQNIVHRDLKPGNIMLINQNGNPDFVKLLDFGLAKIQEQTRLTRTGIIIGTINYVAPEQINGSEYRTPTDIYSLGVLFHEILTGEGPYAGQNTVETLRQILDIAPAAPFKNRSDIPEELNDLVVRMMEKDWQMRPQIREVSDILEHLIAAHHI